MKLVTRLALGGFDGSSRLFRRGGSLALALRRSIHHLVPLMIPGCGGQQPMEPPSDDPPAATAGKDDPSWVLLDCRGYRRDDSAAAAADSKTVAEASLSSTGQGRGRQQHLRVSFHRAATPASSFIYFDDDDDAGTVPDEDDVDNILEVNVIAAHGESILLQTTRGRKVILHQQTGGSYYVRTTYDQLVYRAGTATRPPSLSLLPALSIPRRYDSRRVLHNDNTGILRLGEGEDDELLVAQLEYEYEHHERKYMAELRVLRLGRKRNHQSRQQWELKRSLPILHDQGGDEQLESSLSDPDVTIPVGDRFLCWVSFSGSGGLTVCDMAEDEASPKLRHLPLPAICYDPSYYTNELPPLRDPKGMAAAGPGAVRFVAIEPRCCCGRFGRTSCARCRFAFTVTTWTLTLTTTDDEPMAWVKDGVLDCEGLWAMPGYEGRLPRVHLQSPVVSLDNPDVVCFKVAARAVDTEAWMIQVDMRRKALLAAVPWTTNTSRAHLHLPARL